MINRVLFVLVFFLVGSNSAYALSCMPTSNYSTENGIVHFHPGYGAENPEILPIPNADAKSFERIYIADPIWGSACLDIRWGKDHRHFYYAGREFKVIDPSTFNIVDENYARDVNRVYYQGVPIEGLDPVDFNRDKWEKSFAGQVHHCGLIKLDFKKFNRISEKFVKYEGYVSDRICKNGRIFPVRDPSTFKKRFNEWHIFTEVYFEDSEAIYSKDNEVYKKENKSKFLDNKDCPGAISNDTVVILKGAIVEGADPKTFRCSK